MLGVSLLIILFPDTDWKQFCGSYDSLIHKLLDAFDVLWLAILSQRSEQVAYEIKNYRGYWLFS